jgi:hypothetical protein
MKNPFLSRQEMGKRKNQPEIIKTVINIEEAFAEQNKMRII